MDKELQCELQEVLRKGEEVAKARKVENNILSTMEQLELCLPVFKMYQKLQNQLDSKRFVERPTRFFSDCYYVLYFYLDYSLQVLPSIKIVRAIGTYVSTTGFSLPICKAFPGKYPKVCFVSISFPTFFTDKRCAC